MKDSNKGFALIATLSLMVLIVMLVVALISLSAVTSRNASEDDAMLQAQANARMGLMLAVGELQKSMGPDMRVSASSSILDQIEASEEIDGVAQSNWLGVYDSWGDWLNTFYEKPDGTSLNIIDTYSNDRSAMFRRWLVTLPTDQVDDLDTAKTGGGLDEDNSVVLVGSGTMGSKHANSHPHRVTRAYKMRVGESGRFAWWIGSENQKAQIKLASRIRDLAVDEWAVAQGTTAQVAVGAMTDMGGIDSQTPQMDEIVAKIITLPTLDVPDLNLDPDVTKSRFFDLTVDSKGLLTSVRSGGLKKDLSLLLDRDNNELPAPYKYATGTKAEPSIRPLSSDILAEGAAVPNRPFASWPAMRHYYQMYRTVSDTGNDGKLEGSMHTGLNGLWSGKTIGSLRWNGSKPYTDVLSTQNFKEGSHWTGENAYMRLPLIAKLTFLHSIMTEPNPNVANERLIRHLFSPIVTIWNPYNTEMRFPSGRVGIPASINHSWPTNGSIYRDGALRPGVGSSGLGTHGTYLYSDSGSEIVLEPGEFKVFSYRTRHIQQNANPRYELYPGFDPSAIGGNVSSIDRSYPQQEISSQRIGIKIAFDSYFGWNRQAGHTPGSLSFGMLWGDWDRYLPNLHQIDWFNLSQTLTEITSQITPFSTSTDPVLVGYSQLALKGLSQSNYESINWEEDWRVRNWIQSPPFYFGSGLYMSEDSVTAHTQRLDSPYVVSFGPVSALELPKVVGHIGERAFLGSGANPYEKVTAVPALELPTAPISSLAGFSGMRMSPGWIEGRTLFPDRDGYGEGIWMKRGPRWLDNRMSLVNATTKRVAYQSGITGPGIGNSFMHPMIPKTEIYHHHNNSISHDQKDGVTSPVISSNTRAYCDYWDHVFLLNDALWDDYYVSTLADQTRTGASNALSLSSNLDLLVSGEQIANPRYKYHGLNKDNNDVKQDLLAEDGYLKSAAHLLVDGAFNVNSTSIEAWYALFVGIRERQMYYRATDGSLKPVEIPGNATIAISRLDTPNCDKEVTDPANGVTRDDGNQTWSGVRFLTDAQIRLLAEKCVEEVKKRGPFLNFSEFINRRLSDDELGIMGALQAAIDFDDDSPDPASINYLYKRSSGLMLDQSDLGTHEFTTPEAAVGSRLAGIPGYVIQSDILKPIASTLNVRDDTFRIRSYGESLGSDGRVKARAWCEAILQRIPEYCDQTNPPETAARNLNSAGDFEDNPILTELNRRFGRKIEIVSFRWLDESEI